MEHSADSAAQRNEFMDKLKKVWVTACLVYRKVGTVCGVITTWLYRLRKIFMAIPVVWLATRLADFCREHLPEQVGINLLSTGEFAQMMERATCVNACLWVTGLCLLLMFLSGRARYPWVISIFTLALPLLILATNNFDAFMMLVNSGIALIGK